MSKEIMLWRGEVVSSKMSKNQLLGIIAELGSDLTETQLRATRYLSVADSTKLVEAPNNEQ